jgi:hypothetical protein
MPSGNDLLELARAHINERYIYGAFAPKNDPNWRGPWDCAEFVSWCVYQSCGTLYGCFGSNVERADAYTGCWGTDLDRLGVRVPVDEAAATPGAIILRRPSLKDGHIVIADGLGGTVEAHSTERGVIADRVEGRRWDDGILIPGVRYTRNSQPIRVVAPSTIIRLTSPKMRGDAVVAIQKALAARGFTPGPIDGIYGPTTAAAVRAFQLTKGLVADAEVGPKTAAALGIVLDDFHVAAAGAAMLMK